MSYHLFVLFMLIRSAMPWQISGEQALSKVHWDWRPVGWALEFQPGKQGYLGRTYPDDKKIIIWIRPRQSPEQIASTIVHELAHAFSGQYLNEELRREWLKTRELPLTTPWYPSHEGISDQSCGEGDFAESVAWTLQGGAFNSRLTSTPNRRQRELIKKWLTTLPEGRK